MSRNESGCPFWRKLGFASCAIGFGVPGLFVLDVFTAGVILGTLSAGLAWLMPYLLTHYLLWGRLKHKITRVPKSEVMKWND